MSAPSSRTPTAPALRRGISSHKGLARAEEGRPACGEGLGAGQGGSPGKGEAASLGMVGGAASCHRHSLTAPEEPASCSSAEALRSVLQPFLASPKPRSVVERLRLHLWRQQSRESPLHRLQRLSAGCQGGLQGQGQVCSPKGLFSADTFLANVLQVQERRWKQQPKVPWSASAEFEEEQGSSNRLLPRVGDRLLSPRGPLRCRRGVCFPAAECGSEAGAAAEAPQSGWAGRSASGCKQRKAGALALDMGRRVSGELGRRECLHWT